MPFLWRILYNMKRAGSNNNYWQKSLKKTKQGNAVNLCKNFRIISFIVRDPVIAVFCKIPDAQSK